MALLRSVFETCQPRPELLTGALKEEIFAAKIRPVVEGKAPDVYQDADRFFANTFPTDGLSMLIQEVFGRLSGRGIGSPVIRLETSFGGGKTHDLIALWHICKRGREIAGLDRFADLDLLSERGIQIAAIEGHDLDSEAGNFHAETGITTRTLWGEIAYQIGGVRGYELLKGSDETGITPGSSVLERLVGDAPTVIVIDEIARHLRAAKAKIVGNSDLSSQVVAFLFSLMNFAAASDRVVLVYSLASTSDTFSEETIELNELRQSSARQERVLSPSTDTDIYNIVKQRLFERVSEDAATKAAQEYCDRYRQSQLDLPDGCKESSYRQTFADSYPFHPELFQVLTKKIASIPKFQRTRGALRLLGWVVQQIWRDRPSHTPVIHVHHVPIGVNKSVTDDLTSRLNRQLMRPAIEADIHNTNGREAYAQVQDKTWIAADKPPLASWIARTIFLHSLTQGISSGIRRSELNLALLTPGAEIGLAEDVFERLMNVAWYLDYDPITTIAQFKEEPSLNKIITEETSLISQIMAKEALRDRRNSMFASQIFTMIVPESASDVDDTAETIALCVMDFHDAIVKSSQDPPPPLVEKIFNSTGEANKFRTYRNRLLFLVANDRDLANAIEKTRTHLAIQGILKNANRLQDLSKSQQADLKKRGASLDLDARVALCNAYRHLFYPTKDDVKAPRGLMHYTLPAQDASTIKRNQQEVLLDALRDCTKARSADETIAKPFAPAFVLQKVWPAGLESMTTRSLRDEFAKNLALNLPIAAEIPKLRQTIERGIREGAWDLQVGDRVYIKQDKAIPEPPPIEFSDRQTLYRRGILEPPKPREISLSYQLSGGENDRTIELSWQAEEAISTRLERNGEALPESFSWSSQYSEAIAADTVYRVVAHYDNGETVEREVCVTLYTPTKPPGGGTAKDGGKGGYGGSGGGQLLTVPTEFTFTGTPQRVFKDWDDCVEGHNIKSIAKIDLSVQSGMDYRKIGTAIALMSRFSKNMMIDQNVTIQAPGQFLRFEYQGDLRGFQTCFTPASTFLNQDNVQANVSLTITLRFDPAIEANGSEINQIRTILTRNPVDRLGLVVYL
jgi:hypothetical protein